MRISDWSSDVCSSDLRRADAVFRHLEVVIAIIRAWLLHDADAQHSALVRRFARRLVAWRFCLGLAHGALGICMDTQCRLPYCALSARQSMSSTLGSGKHEGRSQERRRVGKKVVEPGKNRR